MIRFPVHSEPAPTPDLTPRTPRPLRYDRAAILVSEALQGMRSRVTSTSGLVLLAITELALILRLYRLEDLPAAMWGDVIEHYGLADLVLTGHPYLTYYFGGDGPMFSYVVAGLS